MFGLPLQVFSMLGSFIVSFLASRAKAKMELEEAKHKRMVEILAAHNKAASTFLKGEEIKQKDPNFSFTRRVLALGVTAGTMIAIFLIPVFFPNTPWIFEVQTVKTTFLNLFGTQTVNELVQVYGVPFILGEAFTHMVAIIISFYFGNRMGTVKNPY